MKKIAIVLSLLFCIGCSSEIEDHSYLIKIYDNVANIGNHKYIVEQNNNIYHIHLLPAFDRKNIKANFLFKVKKRK